MHKLISAITKINKENMYHFQYNNNTIIQHTIIYHICIFSTIEASQASHFVKMVFRDFNLSY